MKHFLNVLAILSFLPIGYQSFAEDGKSNEQPFFRENKGQIFDQNNNERNDILFSGSSDGLSYFFKQDGVSYQLYHPGEKDNLFVSRIDMTWTGTNPNARVVTENKGFSVDNFYNVPNSGGVTGVRNFGDLRYKNIYQGIDLHYYYKDASLKYDFIVAPYAEYKNIQIKIEGATSIEQNKDGTVSIITPSGTMTEGLPVAYQGNKEIKTNWLLKGNVLSFQLSHYDPSLAIIIDPLVYQSEHLISVYGNSSTSAKPVWYTNCANDNYGNLYTTSYKWYPSSNAYETHFSKIGNNPNNSWEQIISSGGGFGGVWSGCIPTDCSASGNFVYVCGTAKVSGIATTGAYQTTLNGLGDCFIIKYDSSGSKIWGTYYGGTGKDSVESCKADASGNVYLCGNTSSTTSIGYNAYQGVYGGGTSDAFVVKFDANGVRKWGTYFGGNALDDGRSIDINDSRVFVTGSTSSQSGIASSGAHQTTYLGYQAGFLLCLDTSGLYQWSSYYGGDTTVANNCVADNHSVYVCGTTNATTTIATSGSFQSANAGGRDGFLVKFNTNGVRQWGTYYGGLNDETGAGCAFGNNGNVFLCGSTKSSSGIATPWSYNSNYFVDSGVLTGVAYLAELDTLGQRIHGTYCNNRTTAEFCSTSSLGDVFIGGVSYRTFPSPPSTDWYITYINKFSYCNDSAPAIAAPATNICANTAVQISTPSVSGFSYQWYRNDTLISAATNNVYNTSIAGIYKVQVNNCPSGVSAPITINTVPAPSTLISKTDAVCVTGATGSISVIASGGTPPYTYVWDNSTSTTSVLNALIPGTYVVHTSDVNSCVEIDTVTILNTNNNPITQLNVTNVPCYGAPVGSIAVTTSGGTPPYSYIWDNSTNVTSTLSGLLPGIYVVHTMDVNTCTRIDSVTVLQNTTIAPSDPLASICAVTVDSATGKNLIIWEKNGTVNAKAYNIYRESSIAGQYDLIGTKPINQFSTLLDGTSMPLQQSYSYKIAELDSCDHEWLLSDLHKTIHLSSNVGINGEINLSWNQYEGKPYSTHDIMRSFNGGPFTLLNEVSSTITSYSDLTPPTGTLVYRIEIDLGTLCAPGRPTTAQRVTSNNITLGTTGVNGAIASLKTQIIPNPTTGILNMLGDKPAQVRIYDATGRMLLEKRNIDKLDISGYSKGLYLIRFLDKSGIVYYTQKVTLK